MRAMILAAGLGDRMRPLTNTIPKPMLAVNGKPLIQYHVENLVCSGIVDIVINHAVFGHQIEACLGDGGALGANIVYSAEGDKPLGTAGGIVAALPLLGKEPFLVINADIWTDFCFQQLGFTAENLAHIVLVDNPQHNIKGDFYLLGNRVLVDVDPSGFIPRLTFSGISVFSTDFFAECSPCPVLSLENLLIDAAVQGQVSASHYHGTWYDVGTPQRLDALREHCQRS